MTDAVGLVERMLDSLLAENPPADTDPVEFRGAQFDAGLAWVHFPEGRGGLGAPVALQRVVDERLAASGAEHPFRCNPLGVGMLAPTLLKHGTSEQLDRLLRPAFTCEQIWCQLFSEPGAGSDLASLATRAVPDGDGWIINGQKVWTSLAHKAKWGMLLARTDPKVPKHEGIAFFLIDMDQPGVVVRPLKQISGDSEFNEVFLEGAWVADGSRLGEVGQGWAIAGTSLSSERAALSGAGAATSGGSALDRLLDRIVGTDAWADPVDRARVLDLVTESSLIRLTNMRMKAARQSSQSSPARSAVTKAAQGTYNRRLHRAIVDLGGAAGTAWEAHSSEPGPPAPAVRSFLRAQSSTIEGGTSNILRGLLAEQLLGMPREPGGPARDTPWKDIPRS